MSTIIKLNEPLEAGYVCGGTKTNGEKWEMIVVKDQSKAGRDIVIFVDNAPCGVQEGGRQVARQGELQCRDSLGSLRDQAHRAFYTAGRYHGHLQRSDAGDNDGRRRIAVVRRLQNAQKQSGTADAAAYA